MYVIAVWNKEKIPEDVTFWFHCTQSLVSLDRSSNAETTSILHCDESRPFWAEFNYGHIRFGEGHIVGSNMFLEMIDNSAPYVITSYSLHNKVEPTAKFEIYKSSGKSSRLLLIPK